MADQTLAIFQSETLTDKEKLFAAEYLVDLNITQAAIRAGYNPSSAHTTGWDVLQKPEVQDFITSQQSRLSESVLVRQNDIVRELVRIAFHDPNKMFDDYGNIMSLSEMDEDTRRVIQNFENLEMFSGTGVNRIKTGMLRKVKVASKEKALELLGKHFGMFKEQIDINMRGAIMVAHFTSRRKFDNTQEAMTAYKMLCNP